MILHPLLDASLEEQLRDIDSHSGGFLGAELLHCYWNGPVSKRQLASLASCYMANVEGTGSRIVFWTDSLPDEGQARLLERFCEVRVFDPIEEARGTVLEGRGYEALRKWPSFYSDYVRYAALLKHGGFWFDLDVLFFRSFAPLMARWPCFVYSWGRSRHPNGALFYCRDRKPVEDMALLLMAHGGSHLGFQDSFSERGSAQKDLLEYSAEAGLHVLPCGWFDPDWIEEGGSFENLFKAGAPAYVSRGYCYHWHSRVTPIEEGSAFWNACRELEGRYGISLLD